MSTGALLVFHMMTGGEITALQQLSGATLSSALLSIHGALECVDREAASSVQSLMRGGDYGKSDALPQILDVFTHVDGKKARAVADMLGKTPAFRLPSLFGPKNGATQDTSMGSAVLSFYASVANGDALQAASSIGSLSSLESVGDHLLPFAEALAMLDPESGVQLLNGLGSKEDVMRIIEGVHWARLLHIAEILSDLEAHGNLFRLSDASVRRKIKEVLDSFVPRTTNERQAAMAARKLIQDAIAKGRKVVFLTGAGISAESGVPTYRGNTPLAWRGIPFEEIANRSSLRAQPKLVWEFYQERRQGLIGVKPNAAHRAISEFGRSHMDQVVTITQNVDGLHDQAGTLNILHLHGSIWKIKCMDNCEGTKFLDGYDPDLPHLCKNCGKPMRTGVVLFGESLEPGVMDRAFHEVNSAALLVIVGTSAMVSPANTLITRAKSVGAKLIEINTDATQFVHLMDVFILGEAGKVLPYVLDPFIVRDKKARLRKAAQLLRRIARLILR